MPAARRPHLGIAHVPEGRQVFPSLTVMENLELGATTDAGRRDWKENLERILHWLPRLAERHDQMAGTLSGGEQQMLAIGRGLASSPKLLMLDEPSMGLAPFMADFIFERLAEIRRQTRVTVLLVEQRVAEAIEAADYGYVLEAGRVVLEGNHDSPERERPGAPGVSRDVKHDGDVNVTTRGERNHEQAKHATKCTEDADATGGRRPRRQGRARLGAGRRR